MKKAGSMLIVVAMILFTVNYAGAASNGWVTIGGTVTYNGSPVCAMVLANGQFMFTCSGDGSFNLLVPLDGNGQITVYSFCSGLSPFKKVIGPNDGANMNVSLVSPGTGSEFTGPEKSLCDFPFGSSGNFEVRYDYKVYDPNYFSNQYPHGGIVLDLYLGKFATAAERDAVTDSIRKVVFTNKDRGDTYTITQPTKFIYTVDYSGQYAVELGHELKVVGHWEIVVQTNDAHYKGSFALTEDMLEEAPPVPVDASVSENADGSATVTAKGTNGDAYVFRVYNDDGIFFNQQMSYNASTGRYTIDAPANCAGLTARIETRIYANWVLLRDYGNPETCNSNGMFDDWGGSRGMTYIKLPGTPVADIPANIDNEDLIGVWDLSHLEPAIDEVYMHLKSDGTYIFETSSYSLNEVTINSPMFIYGTYSSTGDTLVVYHDYVIDKDGNQIDRNSFDYCWIQSPFHDSVSFEGIYVKDDSSVSTLELTLKSGATITTVDPDTANKPYSSCPDDASPVFTTDFTLGYRYSGTPGNLILK